MGFNLNKLYRIGIGLTLYLVNQNWNYRELNELELEIVYNSRLKLELTKNSSVFFL
jgi:hypothetical protein